MRLVIENEQDIVEVTEKIESVIGDVVRDVLEYENCDFDAEVSVTLTDNDSIREINSKHRNIDKPTDVLSFPMLEFDEDGNAIDSEFDMDDEMVLLGDIVISMERAAQQANEYGHSIIREIAFLTAHSMFHLLGYDHVDDPEGDKSMCQKQEDVLNRLGIVRE